MPYLRNKLRLPSAAACLLVFLAPAVGRGEVVIVSPPDGAVVDPAFTVNITYTDQYFGDTDVEEFIEPDEFEVRADGTIAVACGVECQNNNAAEFQLMLLPGQHELVAVARVSFGFHEEWSEPITITVKGESDTTGGSEGTGGSDGTGEAPTSGSAGETEATGEAPTSGSASDGTGAASTSGADTTGTTAQPPAGSDDKTGCGCDAGAGAGLPWLVVAGLPLRRRRRLA